MVGFFASLTLSAYTRPRLAKTVALDLRLSDLRTLALLGRLGSSAAAARALHVTPSQVSKTIKRVEDALGFTVTLRTVRGVELNDEGRWLAQEYELLQQKLDARLGRVDRTLTIATPSFLAPLTVDLLSTKSHTRWRCLEMPMSEIRAYSSSALFDVALANEAPRKDSELIGVKIGDQPCHLFASANSILPDLISQPMARTLAYVGAVYRLGDQMSQADDQCPLPASQRTFAVQVQTALMALELVAGSQELVSFCPRIPANPLIAARRIRIVEVEGWDVRLPVYLWVRGNELKKSELDRLAESARILLKKLSR